MSRKMTFLFLTVLYPLVSFSLPLSRPLPPPLPLPLLPLLSSLSPSFPFPCACPTFPFSSPPPFCLCACKGICISMHVYPFSLSVPNASLARPLFILHAAHINQTNASLLSFLAVDVCLCSHLAVSVERQISPRESTRAVFPAYCIIGRQRESLDVIQSVASSRASTWQWRPAWTGCWAMWGPPTLASLCISCWL